MLHRLLADIALILHFLFIIFVIFGGLLVFKWNRVIWLHVPCATWGALLEIYRWICPLTYLENYYRKQAGISGYPGSFIEYYLLPVIYPTGLTANTQIILGIIVIVINLIIYGYLGWPSYHESG